MSEEAGRSFGFLYSHWDAACPSDRQQAGNPSYDSPVTTYGILLLCDGLKQNRKWYEKRLSIFLG